MGYGIHVIHKNDRDSYVRIKMPTEKQVGSNICISDNEIYAEFSITYNYGSYFREIFGEEGIRSLYNTDLIEVIERINSGIVRLIRAYYPNDKYFNARDKKHYKPEEIDYWTSCPYNVIKQLDYMRTVLQLVLEGENNTDCILVGD